MATRPRSPALQRRSAARLAAVQGLYEAVFAQVDPQSIIALTLRGNRGARLTEDEAAEIDQQFYVDLLRGAWARREEIDEMLAASLSGEWRLERIEPLLKAILRCGVYELMAMDDTPVKVAVTEYVALTEDFFAEREPKMVNAVLDRLARRLREAALPDGNGRGE